MCGGREMSGTVLDSALGEGLQLFVKGRQGVGLSRLCIFNTHVDREACHPLFSLSLQMA